MKFREDNKNVWEVKVETSPEALRTYSLSLRSSSLEGLKTSLGRAFANMYSAFTFEPLHNLHHNLSNPAKQGGMERLSLDGFVVEGQVKGEHFQRSGYWFFVIVIYRGKLFSTMRSPWEFQLYSGGWSFCWRS